MTKKVKTTKKIEEIETKEKNDLNIGFISLSNLNLNNNIIQANEIFYTDEKTAELLKESIFYKKGVIKSI